LFWLKSKGYEIGRVNKRDYSLPSPDTEWSPDTEYLEDCEIEFDHKRGYIRSSSDTQFNY